MEIQQFTRHNIGVTNQGDAAASGESFTLMDVVKDGQALTRGQDVTTLNLAPGTSTVITLYDTTVAESLLEEIWTTGRSEVTVQYMLDYATNGRSIIESDETNNDGEYGLVVDSSMYSIAWVEAECLLDSDCSSGYVCEAYTCI